MAGGLVALLDDIAALAKLAAATLDDASAAALKASSKTVGIVVDDAAVTPTYVQGLAAERELPIIKKIAAGSLRNKLVFILPAALLLSAVAPKLIEVILIFGGGYLAYEGAHKIHARITGHGHDHDDDLPAAMSGEEAEKKTISSAVRTDLILSTEIMVLALKEVIDDPFINRLLVLVIVAFLMTAIVYGAVALIVKMDDVGLRMATVDNGRSERIGRALVAAMPKVLSTLTVVGTAAMLWVGGHILLSSAAALGWHGPYDLVHRIEQPFHDVSGVGGVLGWVANTLCSAIVGLMVGLALLFAGGLVQRKRGAH
ncbi:MAG: DUF808 domain-containing protein [Microthrixaceae bacterium]|nr:DUF808 domain-containing protein [Microthrixaceae bacterium]MCO5313277.1 DUF808 domain-containing protein [Microthrixaceae bacterium]HPB44850.1 DUF808 domain-containing protein [Microthrixaceae bacterium]